MRIRVQLVADGVNQIADHTFDVAAPSAGVPALVIVRDQAGHRQPDAPHVPIVTGYGRVTAAVTVEP